MLAARAAPSADNSQPWSFRVSPGRLVCQYCARGASDPFGPLGHASLLAAGAIHENLAKLGLSGAVAEAPVRRLSDDDWELVVEHDEGAEHALPEVAVSGIYERHTNRYPFKKRAVDGLAQLLPEAGVRLEILDSEAALVAMASSVDICSRARFNDPDLHRWLFSSLRWSEAEAASGAGLDIATLHLPPGGRWFMRFISPWERMRLFNRCGLYRILAAADSGLLRRGPAIIAVVGGQSTEEIWDAGRVMQRTWIALNRAGIAVHPYYVVTDLGNRFADGRLLSQWRKPVGQALGCAAELLKLSQGERIHMLFRVGYATAEPVRSRRLPLEFFLDQPHSN